MVEGAQSQVGVNVQMDCGVDTFVKFVSFIYYTYSCTCMQAYIKY